MLVVVVVLRHRLQEDFVRPGERRDQIDVTVGIAILDQALAEPDNALLAEGKAQRGVDLVLRQRWVA